MPRNPSHLDGWKTSCENYELEMRYRVKRMGLVRIMRYAYDYVELSSILTILKVTIARHYISRKSVVVGSISPVEEKPNESQLIVKSGLMPTCAKHK